MLVIGPPLMASPASCCWTSRRRLAPMLVEEIFEIVDRLPRAEAHRAAGGAERGAGAGHRRARLRDGERPHRLDGSAEALRENADIKEFYLGLTEVAPQVLRDVKHYKRRKRWLS